MPERQIGRLMQVKVDIDIRIAGLVALLGVVICLSFILFPGFRAELKFFSAVIGGMAGVYSAYYAGSGLRAAVEQGKAAVEQGKVAVEQGKIQRSIEFSKRFSSTDLARLRSLLHEFDKEEVRPSEFHSSIINDSERLLATKAVLGIFEEVSVSVQLDHANELALYKNFNFVVPWAFDRLKPYVDRERDICDDRTIYCETEKLANSWKAGRYLLTGEKLPKILDT
jgi:hypothetical protein